MLEAVDARTLYGRGAHISAVAEIRLWKMIVKRVLYFTPQDVLTILFDNYS